MTLVKLFAFQRDTVAAAIIIPQTVDFYQIADKEKCSVVNSHGTLRLDGWIQTDNILAEQFVKRNIKSYFC